VRQKRRSKESVCTERQSAKDQHMEEQEVEKEPLGKDEKKKEANAFVRLKERMSNRKKRKKGDKYAPDTNPNGKEEMIGESMKCKIKPEEPQFGRESELKENNYTNGDHSSVVPKKKNEGNFIQRLIRRLSFKSKKKPKQTETKHTEGSDIKNDASETDNSNKLDEFNSQQNQRVLKRNASENSLEEDLEIQAICKDDKEEEVVTPSVPIITSNRPPLPTGRRIPPSATSTQSRPVSQLDAALKQFKVSTAASRENLRSSRVDLEKMEDTVRNIVASRPSSRAATPTPGGWRSRAPPENRQLSEQWAKLSASLTDLR